MVTDVADVLASADYLAKQDFVDGTRMGILGHSRGGMVTVLHEGSVLAEGDLATVQNDERVIEVYLGR